MVSAHFVHWVLAPCDREGDTGLAGQWLDGAGGGMLGVGGCPSIPGGAWQGVGAWEGCRGGEQHPPAHAPLAAGAALSPLRPQDECAQPSPGNPLAVSEAVGSPDRARCQRGTPQHVPWAVWRWCLAGGAAPGCRTGLALVMGAEIEPALGLGSGYAPRPPRQLLDQPHWWLQTPPAPASPGPRWG